MSNKQEVTEQDIRLPQFRDAKLEDLEFDATGEVVRKDRFQTSMRKLYGKLCGINGLSSHGSWTCEQVVGAVEQLLRFKQLVLALNTLPEDAEFYHFECDVYVKDIDQEHLQIARSEPEASHLINHMVCEDDSAWEENSAWLGYIDHLISIDDMKKEIANFGEVRNG
ncbi:hypothetical protein [Acinetobacter guerrae]|uniref:hypothetical protein n=1 Tax=Acinetobacter guerrae TaxID=1843371 RepID=UPI00128D0227|nr:hypothetical protein [Acinetobacter guerrae]MPW43354.1 hypothetical protein [Acinetobacter guerrae]